MNKKITIIGGGIAGLSTGIYGQINGYHTEIIEMHTNQAGSVPPGNERVFVLIIVCTGW